MKIKRYGGLLLLCLSTSVVADTTYRTWAPWEPDSAIAAWAIHRFVQPQAHFESVPKGTALPPANTLDTAEAQFRRGALHTTFEAVVQHFDLQFSCLDRLKRHIRLIELTPWQKAKYPDVEQFEQHLVPLLPQQPQPGGLIAAFSYIDRVCQP